MMPVSASGNGTSPLTEAGRLIHSTWVVVEVVEVTGTVDVSEIDDDTGGSVVEVSEVSPPPSAVDVALSLGVPDVVVVSGAVGDSLEVSVPVPLSGAVVDAVGVSVAAVSEVGTVLPKQTSLRTASRGQQATPSSE